MVVRWGPLAEPIISGLMGRPSFARSDFVSTLLAQFELAAYEMVKPTIAAAPVG
jgi:hypothetical protein